MNDKLRIRVWNEGVHEALNEPSHIGEIYPDGIHGAIAAGLRGLLPGRGNHDGDPRRP